MKDYFDTLLVVKTFSYFVKHVDAGSTPAIAGFSGNAA
jgi:hypothetical protein